MRDRNKKFGSGYARRGPSEDKGNRSALLKIGLCTVFILGISGYVGYEFLQDKVDIDKATGCPMVNGSPTPSSNVVVVIDGTEPISSVQASIITNDMDKLARVGLKPGEMISVYRITEDVESSRRPLFEMCKPRDGSDADAISENASKMRRQFMASFKEPLGKVLDELMKLREPAPASPIFEVLQSVSVNSIQKWDPPEGTKLLLYSDMLHNTQGYSLYRNTQNFEKFRKTDYAQTIVAKMPATEVSMKMFISSPKYQKNSLGLFWTDYFRNTGASVTSIEPIGK